MHSPQGNISTVQIFHDGLNDALRDCAAKFESAGYRVQFAPASGPPAVWFGHYEVVGQRAITAFAEHVAKTGQEPTEGLALYQVPDNADNKPARESVRLLGEPFKTVICPPSVRDLYRMPFISDEATGRHFGLESIRRFVEVRLAASGAARLTGARQRTDDNLRSVFGEMVGRIK